MGRGRWGLVVVATLAFSVVAAWGVAVFPNALYVYREPADVIRKSDFSPVAQEVEAIERTLGVGLENIARVHAPCYRLDGPVAGETLETIWTAPYAGRIVEVTCDATGANSQALFDLQVDDGTPALLGVPGSCATAVATFTPASGATMAKGDRLDLVLGDIVGSVSRLSVCWVFQPGA